jgi:carbonic anhydrase
MTALHGCRDMLLNRLESGAEAAPASTAADSSAGTYLPGLSRRRFLGGAPAAVAFAAAAVGGMELAGSRPVAAQTKMTPDEALNELMDGNARFASGHGTSCEHDLALLKEHNAEKQEPFAAVLSCADSRVPVELVFDQSIGHLFVTRVAGNIVTPEIIGSLEYGAAVLGTVALLVLGHAHCGAVKAAIAGKEVPGQISSLYAHIRPAVDQAGPDLEETVRVNAKIQASLLRKASPVLAGLIKEKRLKIGAGYYDLQSGKVTLLE